MVKLSGIHVYIIVIITGIDDLQGFRVVGLGGFFGLFFWFRFLFCFGFVFFFFGCPFYPEHLLYHIKQGSSQGFGFFFFFSKGKFPLSSFFPELQFSEFLNTT